MLDVPPRVLFVPHTPTFDVTPGLTNTVCPTTERGRFNVGVRKSACSGQQGHKFGVAPLCYKVTSAGRQDMAASRWDGLCTYKDVCL
jgi:hypothetical protein